MQAIPLFELTGFKTNSYHIYTSKKDLTKKAIDKFKKTCEKQEGSFVQ